MVLCRVLPVILTIFFCSNAIAQLENGSVIGTVRDSEGQFVADVTITASSESLVDQRVRSITDSEGRYRFAALPPGIYELQAEMSGFATIIRRDIRLFVGNTLTIDFSLEVAGVEESVEVSGASPLIDLTSASVQHTVALESVEGLPKFDSVLDLMTLTPGVGDLDLAAYGAAGEAANSYWYDGVDVRSPASGHFVVLPSYNWIEEVQVVGLGAPAEYGGFTGVVGNYVTRSGGNDFHGLVETFFSNESLLSENARDSIEDNFYLVNSAAQIGGPIRRDKFWFFAGFQYSYDQRQPFNFAESVTARLPQIFSKLTYKIDQNHTLQGSAYYDHLSVDNDGAVVEGATVLPEATANSKGGAWSWNATWLGVLSPQTLFEARLGGYDNGGFKVLPKNGDAPGHFDAGTLVYSVNFPTTNELVRKRVQVNASMSHYANDFLGQHDFKFGAEFERSRSHSFAQYNSNLYYYDYFGYAYLRYSFDAAYNTDDSIHRTSVFVQDNWTPSNRLRFDFGVRFDHISGEAALQTIAFNDVAPRLGFTYDLRENGNTILKSHYGHYYDGFFDGFLQLFNNSPTKTLQEFQSGEWINVFTFRPLNSLDSDLKQTYIRQFVIGLEQQVSHDIVFGVRYIYRRWNDIIDNQNISGQYEPVPFFNPITQESITVFNRVDQGDTEFLVTNPPGLFRKYDGFEVTGEKRFSNNLFLAGSIVISRAEGNIDNADRARNASDPVFNDPNFNINIDGKLVNDPTYQIKIYGGYQFPLGINSSFIFRHESGDTWTPLIAVRGLNQGRVNILGLPRGSNRFPSRNILDLRAEKGFEIYNDQLLFTVDIFNVFNTSNVLDVNRIFGSPTFQQPTAISLPREVRLGVRYRF